MHIAVMTKSLITTKLLFMKPSLIDVESDEIENVSLESEEIDQESLNLKMLKTLKLESHRGNNALNCAIESGSPNIVKFLLNVIDHFKSESA